MSLFFAAPTVASESIATITVTPQHIKSMIYMDVKLNEERHSKVSEVFGLNIGTL